MKNFHYTGSKPPRKYQEPITEFDLAFLKALEPVKVKPQFAGIPAEKSTRSTIIRKLKEYKKSGITVPTNQRMWRIEFNRSVEKLLHQGCIFRVSEEEHEEVWGIKSTTLKYVYKLSPGGKALLENTNDPKLRSIDNAGQERRSKHPEIFLDIK